ncbi:MAG: C25 family cysteine peptidase [Candidatus Thorarchaeota archaeon]
MILISSGFYFPQINTSSKEINNSLTNNIDYLIITKRSFSNYLEPLALWKTQKGLLSEIEAIEDIEAQFTGFDTAEKIRNCIKQYYNERNTKWVVLAGGETVVPSRTVLVENALVCSDYYYSNLDENWLVNSEGIATLIDVFDWEAEVYVGRLPADTINQMKYLVTRILNYEKNPPVGSWMTHALFGGTFANFNTDSNGNNIFDEDDNIAFDTNRNHNWLKTNSLPDDWTSTLLAEREGLIVTNYSYDGALNTASFISEVNTGAGIIMVDSHGSPYGMTRTVFTEDVDEDGLFDYNVDSIESRSFLSTSSKFNTNGKNGFYWLAACSTGTFTDGTCLSEYLVRNCAIGCIASYESAYYDPFWYGGDHLGWYTQGLSSRFWEQLLIQGYNQPGKAFSLAKMDYVSDHFALGGIDTEGITLTQYNLMGDPEIPIWIEIPDAIEPEVVLNEETGIVAVTAIANGLAISNVTVSLTSDTSYYCVVTNESGKVELELPNLGQNEEIILTLSKNNLLPYQSVLKSNNNKNTILLLSVIYTPIVISFIIIIIVAIRLRITRK